MAPLRARSRAFPRERSATQGLRKTNAVPSEISVRLSPRVSRAAPTIVRAGANSASRLGEVSWSVPGEDSATCEFLPTARESPPRFRGGPFAEFIN